MDGFNKHVELKLQAHNEDGFNKHGELKLLAHKEDGFTQGMIRTLRSMKVDECNHKLNKFIYRNKSRRIVRNN